MSINFSLHRFEEFGQLSAAELASFNNAVSGQVRYKRHKLVRAQGVKPVSFFLLVDGWVASARTAPNGKRQIFKVHLPGDVVGTPSMCMDMTVEDIICLTDATLIEMPLTNFWRLFEEHPRFGARFLLSIQLERVALMDRLALSGPSSALSQLAALIIDFADRLMPLGLVQNDSYTLQLIQEQIGDLLGITGVHLNRKMRELDDYGLISRTGQRITILDRPNLERLAQRRRGIPLRDQTCLPKAR